MRDRRLYDKILGLPTPWYVQDVQLRHDASEILIEVALHRPLKLACPECGEPMVGYDHRRRRWRHLDTCQYKTIIEADVPRGPVTEGINSKIQWIKHTARGFANRDNFRVAILFHCGHLDLYPH